MKFSHSLFFALLVLLHFLASAGEPKRTLLLELRSSSPEQARQLLSIVNGQREDAVFSQFRDRLLFTATKAEAEVMRERGFNVTVLMEDTSALTLAKRALYGPSMKMPAAYHTYERIVAEADALVRQHPERILKISIGETTQEHRTIYAFKIADDVRDTGDRPAILFDACHHADEVMGAEICSSLMHEMVEGFNRDPKVTAWLKEYTIYIIPVVNVDGHTVVTHSIDPRWRKNTRDTNNNGVLYDYPEGVDVNRNYDFNWAHGGSTDTMSERYRGAYPFSEAENRAVRDFMEAHKILLSISYHSQGEVIYYPWTWQGRKAPEDSLLGTIAHGLASSIRTMKGDTCYKAEYGAGTVGQTYPWLYGNYGTFDFVVETGNGTHIFPEEEMEGIVKSNLEGAHYIIDRGTGPGLHATVKDAQTGKPLVAAVRFPTIETEDVRWRITDTAFGSSWRLLLPGTYSVLVMKEGYQPFTGTVTIGKSGWTALEIRLKRGLNN